MYYCVGLTVFETVEFQINKGSRNNILFYLLQKTLIFINIGPMLFISLHNATSIFCSENFKIYKTLNYLKKKNNFCCIVNVIVEDCNVFEKIYYLTLF